MEVAKPSLIVDLFAPISGAAEDRAAVRRYLAAAWDACGTLGMDEPLLPDLPVTFPTWPERSSRGFTVLAGRSGTTGTETVQAFVYARHDVVGLRATLATDDDPAPLTSWAEQLQRWHAAAAPARSGSPEALLGTSLTFLALAEGRAARPATDAAAGSAVWETLHAAGLECWEPAFETAEGAAMWDGRTPAGDRVVAVLGRSEHEADLSRWLWWQGDQELARFGSYLLHAAKLSYEARVYDVRRARLEDGTTAVDGAVDRVLALDRTLEVGRRTSFERLTDAQAELARAQTGTSGLAIEMTYLKALQRTVRVAQRNLGQLSPMPAAGTEPAADSMFARDQARASWLAEQLEQDLGYAEAVRSRAKEAHDLTSLRLQQATARLTRSQTRITLLQTSLVGALVTIIGATGPLGVKLDLPGPVRVPVLGLLVSLLVAAPALAVHWHERYGFFDHLAAAFAGAAAGWLLVSAAGGGDSVPLLVVAVAAGAAVALGLTRFHDATPGDGRITQAVAGGGERGPGAGAEHGADDDG